MSMSPNCNMSKDEDYYLECSIFLVEDTLFKLPRYMFESQSSVFDAMFTLPPIKGEYEGQIEEQPIRLEGIKKDDFRVLLRLLYPKKFGLSVQLSEGECLSVLALSTQWAMDGVRTLAIESLSDVLQKSPHKLITLGKKYDVPDWVFVGVEMLVRREKPLEEADVTALGVAEVLRLASIRECIRPMLRTPRDALTQGRGAVSRSQDLDTKILTLYGLLNVPAEKDRRRLDGAY